MLRGFGIRVVPCRFRQDNRDFYIDHGARTISDALTSVKHISRRVADTMYGWREEFFPRFTDLLYEMEMNPAFDSQVVEILIRIGYFEEFGSSGKLLRLYREFKNGESRFSKSHVIATQEKRLNTLRNMEDSLEETSIPIHETVAFEIAMCGSPFSTDEASKNQYAVLDVDDHYSPKLRLYSITTGRTGIMKVKKALFRQQPLQVGSILLLNNWEQRPTYHYIGGKTKPDYEHKELWITDYRKLL